MVVADYSITLCIIVLCSPIYVMNLWCDESLPKAHHEHSLSTLATYTATYTETTYNALSIMLCYFNAQTLCSLIYPDLDICKCF